MDEGESVRSGRSERSERSHRSHGSNHHSSGHHRHATRPQVPNRNASGRGSSRSGRDDMDRDDRSVTIKTPGQEMDVERGVVGMEERIQVQVIPQDDNWGDNTTAITGNTSETGFSMEDLTKYPFKEQEHREVGVKCARCLGTVLTCVLSVAAFLSPIAMVLLPKLDLLEWDYDDQRCRPECEGLLISMAFKLLVLLVGAVALFFRKPRATMPRVFVFRAVVLFLVFVVTFAFWLFYGVRILKEKQRSYEGMVKFAVSLVDSLLFIHYVAIILLEIRQLQPQFAIRVVRSPDGEAKVYTVGLLSIQRAAVHVLENYYCDFETFNPYLENVTKKHSKQSSTAFKVYDIDGNAPNNQQMNQARSRAIFAAAAARRRETGHNDRFYDEQEYERRVRKRRARLMVATEEAFTHIKRSHEEQGPSPNPMDPMEAAAAVFPSLARPLQKFLRITRQQPRYTMDAVLNHLAVCISHDASPRAFLAKYLSQGAIICGNDTEVKATESWVVVCEQVLTRELDHGVLFQLKKGPVSLLCSVSKLPHFSLTEKMLHPKSNRFVLRLNSETSV